MNILFITPRFPFPPIKGDRLRSFYFIRELSKKHTVHLFSFIESCKEREYLSVLKKYCKNVDVIYLPQWMSILKMLMNVPMRKPFQISYYYSKEMNKLLRDVIRNARYDLIHVALIRMAPYIEKMNTIPVIIDHIDCLSLNMERRYKTERGFLRKSVFKKEWEAMKEYEYRYREVPSIVTSEKDKAALNGYNEIKVISNGVDLERFQYTYNGDTVKDIDILFVGNMGYFPNEQAMAYFFNSIYSILKNFKKNLRVYVVGSNPVRKIRALSDNLNVFVTGFVEDVRRYFYRAKVFIAPLQSGSGIQNKILEAMACGVPVVSTSIGNSGIGAKDREEIIIADEPENFAVSVLEILDSEDKRRSLSCNARKLVERDFSWGKRGQELESFYRRVISFAKR